MSKIPKIAKFRGDNGQSWVTWIAEYEAHVRALGVANNKFRDILLCSTESTAFTFLAQKISDDNNISYNNVKIEMKDVSSATITDERFRINFENTCFEKV